MSLREQYNKEIAPRLMKEFNYRNVMQVPRMAKVTLNAASGQSLQDEKVRDNVVASLERISGQHPVLTLAKKSISSFKIREGMAIGVKVTLRGTRMYDFIEKFVKVALPRTRDFRGLPPKSFDGNGNATFGIREHLVFPEINPDQVDRVYGLEVCITTTAKTDAEGIALLRALGFPFKTIDDTARQARRLSTTSQKSRHKLR